MQPNAPSENAVSPWSVITRGVFLACSWTWCIGMFFPVYMIRDFGVLGWVAFAVPNVIGAALMGTVLRSPRESEELVHRHTPAMRWFSIITVLFHVHFASWFFEVTVGPELGDRHLAGPIFAWLMLVAGCLLAAMGSRGWYRLAPWAWTISVAMGVAAALTGDTLGMPETTPRHTPGELAMALPVLVFGFALCPYLDLTFLRVRRETPGAHGERAFWIGFVVFFLPMIVFTLLYMRGVVTGAGFSFYVLAHIWTQTTFTVGAHLRELFTFGVIRSRDTLHERSSRASAHAAPLQAGTALALLGVATLGVALTYLGEMREGYSFRRLGYELFMSFYALVFPAYVWIVVIERGLTRPTRLLLYLLALILAAPCLWLGYIEQRYIWLLPGVAIPVALPLLWSAFRGRGAAGASDAPSVGLRQRL